MKIERINSKDYWIFINFFPVRQDFLLEDVKTLFLSFQKILSLKGFYKVFVYMKSVGTFFHVLYVDDSFYKDHIDLKVELKEDELYFVTEDYSIVKDFSSIFFYHDKYYVPIEETLDLIKMEFGYYCLKNQLSDMFQYGIRVK